MAAILNLQRLAVSADAGEQVEDAFLASNSSYHCSGWMDSCESHWCTDLETQFDLG